MMRTNTDFLNAIAHNLKGVEAFSTGACPGCETCLRNFGYVDSADRLQWKKFRQDWESGKIADEGSFTRENCSSCGLSLGHNGYVAHGIVTVIVSRTVTLADGRKQRHPTKRTRKVLIHFDDICPDCVQYHANGELPEED